MTLYSSNEEVLAFPCTSPDKQINPGSDLLSGWFTPKTLSSGFIHRGALWGTVGTNKVPHCHIHFRKRGFSLSKCTLVEFWF